MVNLTFLKDNFASSGDGYGSGADYGYGSGYGFIGA